jgi:hypothetical protein
MRTLIVIACVLVMPATALAQASDAEQDVFLHGWTHDGKFVVEFRDSMALYDGWGWAASATKSDDGAFWAVCTPQSIANAQEDGEGACQPCKDAASCGLEVDGSKLASAKRSPDRRVSVKDKRACKHKHCVRTLGFGKAGKLVYAEISKDKAPLSVYFRPDSSAALVVLIGSVYGADDVPAAYRSDFFVVDFGAAASAKVATYSIDLTHIKTSDQFENPGNCLKDAGEGATGRVVVKETADKSRTVEVEQLALMSCANFDEKKTTIEFGPDLTPQLISSGQPDGDDFTDAEAAAVKAKLPAGTVTARGFVDQSTLAGYTFVVYAVVVDGTGAHLVKQRWSDESTEPSEQTTLDAKL